MTPVNTNKKQQQKMEAILGTSYTRSGLVLLMSWGSLTSGQAIAWHRRIRSTLSVSERVCFCEMQRVDRLRLYRAILIILRSKESSLSILFILDYRESPSLFSLYQNKERTPLYSLYIRI